MAGAGLTPLLAAVAILALLLGLKLWSTSGESTTPAPAEAPADNSVDGTVVWASVPERSLHCDAIAPPSSPLVSELVGRMWNPNAVRRSCPAYVALYPSLERLVDDVIAAADQSATLALFSGRRQFLADVLLIAQWRSHPCRTPWREGDPWPAAARESGNHVLYVIPAPVATISKLDDHRRASFQGALQEAFTRVFTGDPFLYSAESHVLLHTSTESLKAVFPKSWLKLVDDDWRPITVTFEGVQGDPRGAKLVPGPRALVVPYYTEMKLLAYRAMCLPGGPPRRDLRVFLRASWSPFYGPLRTSLVNAFAPHPQADVRLVREACATCGNLSNLLQTASAMATSIFCLIPAGRTASTRRLFEAIEVGCIPVILSDHLTLPFEEELHEMWKAGVIWHREKKARSVPARLAALGAAEVGQMQHALDALRPALAFVPGHANGGSTPSTLSAGELTWRALLRLQGLTATVRPGPAGRAWLLPKELIKAVHRTGTLVLTTCAASKESTLGHGVRPKRATTDGDCLRFHRSLRETGCAAPLAIFTPGRPSNKLSAAFKEDHQPTWIIANVSARAGRNAPSGTKAARKTLKGNQLRLVWYLTALDEVRRAAPDALVLALDARDVYIQENPFTAFAAQLALKGCRLVFTADTQGAARNDSYFLHYGSDCLPESALEAIGQGAPLNGGVIYGRVRLLHRLYVKAAALATSRRSKDPHCRDVARDQHLITGAGYEMSRQSKATGQRDVCILPNDPLEQDAVINLGITNHLGSSIVLRWGTHTLESSATRRPIAIVHQYDRKRDISQLLRAKGE